MIITHKNTGTLGDFATQLPLLSALKANKEYIHLSLPKKYRNFSGLKVFLETQDFIDEVDFDDRKGDLDIQAHLCNADRPCRARYTANQLNLQITPNINIKYKNIDIPKEFLNLPIVIDKNTPNNNRPIMAKSGSFPLDKYLYLKFDDKHDINFNINICAKTNCPIYACLTGFPVLLQYFQNIYVNIVWFSRQDQLDLSIPFYGESKPFYETYFALPNLSLIYWKDL